MANSMPFNSINADRPYKAEDWAWYFGTFIGNGVFPKPETGLQVVANEGMKITVNEGKAFINGYAFKNPSNYEITLDTADGALARIDRVVVRWDLVNRDMYIEVLKGTVSASPVAQAITRDTETYDLVLADIYIGKGVTSIAQANITDQRFNTSVCGIVKGTVEEIDTSVIIAQFEDFVKTYQDEQLAEFEEWVESIKDVLNESAAGNLQLQIDEHTEKSVPSEVGAHGFRYFEGKLQAHIYDEESMTLKWVTVPGSGIAYDGEKSVQGAIDEVKGAIGSTSTNLMPYPYIVSTYEYNGISYTELGDGRIKANGTNSSGDSSFYLQNYVLQKLNNSKVILSLKSTSGLASVFFRFWGEGNVYIEEYDFNIIKQNGEITIDVPRADNYDFWTVELFYEKGITVIDDIVEIMIRPASIKDNTYKSPVTSVRNLIKTYETDVVLTSITVGNFGDAILKRKDKGTLLSVTPIITDSSWVSYFINGITADNITVRMRNHNTQQTISPQVRAIVTYLDI